MDTSKLEKLIGEYAELEQRLADPDVHADRANARKLGRRHAELAPIVQVAEELKQDRADWAAARELADQDASFAEEAEQLVSRIEQLEARITDMLLPRDEHDSSDVLLEVKSGAGGEESALFAGDLLRMYLRFAERQGWRTDVLNRTESDLGGCKDATVSVKAKGDPGRDGVWSKLKYEGGVHRVQRVPVTESQGRVHTSAAGVLVYPEPEEVEVEVDEKDLRIDVFRASGPGGQSVNTTDSAVRITHRPTGIVVSCQNQKSQLQNKLRAIQVLRARLQAMAEEQAQQEAVETRRSQVRTVDRSERIRTYNFPENRISDHRVNFKAYNLDQVLDGDLDAVLAALSAADRDERIAATS